MMMTNNQNKKYDLVICYRIYPNVSKVPPIFSENKLKLAELCLASFKNALNSIAFKLFVLLDSCPHSYSELFQKYFAEDELELITLQNAGNPGSFGKQTEVLLNQNLAEIVYFAEDDYFYLPNAFEKMINAFSKNPNFHFLSPYNHPDYKNLLLHNYNSDKIEIDTITWKTVSTTTMTFMTTKTILKDTLGTFLTYTRKNNDNSIWLALTKKQIFNPYLYFHYLIKNKTLFKALIKIWIYSPFQATFGKTYKLWVPNQTLATHMESNYLADDENWEYWFNLFRKKHNI